MSPWTRSSGARTIPTSTVCGSTRGGHGLHLLRPKDHRHEAVWRAEEADIEWQSRLPERGPGPGLLPRGDFRARDQTAYDRDILAMKELGFNMLRKHIKVEPDYYYAACDRHGMLVMQDMVQSGHYSFIWDTFLPYFQGGPSGRMKMSWARARTGRRRRPAGRFLLNTRSRRWWSCTTTPPLLPGPFSMRAGASSRARRCIIW